MIITNWHVITGGPSSGKTTLINELAKTGFSIAPEVAREYINQLLADNLSLKEISQDVSQLQRQILAGALKRERTLPKEQLIFFDRGTPDSIGYFRYYDLKTDKIIHACGRTRYKKLFYCHQLPVEYDSVRVENQSSAKKIGEFIYESYKSLGYELIELPAVSIEQRIELIFSHLELPR